MDLKDMNFNKDYVLESVGCRLAIQETILDGVGQVTLTEDGGLLFANQGKRYSFQVLNDEMYRQVQAFLKRGFFCAAAKTDNTHSQVFHLRMVFFASVERWGPLNLVANNQIMEKLESRLSKNIGSVENLFTLQIGQTAYFAYSIRDVFPPEEKEPGRAAEDDGSDGNGYEEMKAPADSDGGTRKKRAEEQDKVIRIYGENCVLQARLTGEDMDAYLYVEKMQSSVNNAPCLRLGIGRLCFSEQREFVSKKVRDTLRSTPGYISLWDQYSEQEGEFLLQKAREVSLLEWVREGISAEQGGILVPVRQECIGALRLIQAGDYISFQENTPPYLLDLDLSWKTWEEAGFTNELPGEGEVNDDGGISPPAYHPRPRAIDVKVLKNTGSALLLDAQSLPQGCASLSIVGDQRQISRRKKSRSLIHNGLAANPNLGLIIEGISNADRKPVSGGKHHEPLSPLVLDKIFSHDPTPTQRRAIELALNTPDIAIIQGPPGTGKTTVITAIIERLNEIASKDKLVRGEVLVTSLQHDAVKNIQERLSINSIPTIKFGSSRKQDQAEEFDLATEAWCKENAGKLRERHLGLRQSETERELAKLADWYIRTPNEENALAFLRYAVGVTTDKDISAELHALIQELEIHTKEDYSDVIRILRRLRTTKTSFADDGPERAMDAEIALEKLLTQSESSQEILRALQQAAMANREDVPVDLLTKLRSIRETLLARCFPPPFYRQPTPRKDILSVCERVQQKTRIPGNEEDRILAEYLDELEHNTAAVQESLKNYCFVFTATLQQSEGKDILRAKRGAADRANRTGFVKIEYDTVIVDEAARASPGDLMIPLARARGRIILVGDHRQLPHMYDEDIFEAMTDAGKPVHEADIKTSLFQHLFENAKKLEKADGIQRTITLDAQYRMHPVLGKFVSSQFYESHGEQFASPLSEDFFSQPLVPGPVKWFDVPQSSGREDRDARKSRFRMCEARLIVNQLKEYLDNPAVENLSFGVISFYSAQVKKIHDMLVEDQAAAEAMRSGRLRVGSVDSFQGMEFDVIFLSVVRSGSSFSKIDLKLLARDEEYARKTGLSCYGFLTSENRLCVALSRQKRLLIIVGDSSMFLGGTAGQVASRCVPAMSALYQLCREKGVVEEC